MAKIIDQGLLPPAHPIYSSGPEMLSPRAFNPSSTNSAPAAAGATPAKSSSAPSEIETEEDGIKAEALRRL